MFLPQSERPSFARHKNPPLVPTPSQKNPIHTHTSYLFKIHINTIRPSMSRSPKWFSDQYFVRICHLSYVSYMHRPSHPPCFDFPNNIWWGVQLMKFLIM
jgi:hypothetical protein